MMQTDTEKSDILQRKDIEDDEKQKLYYANLERYMNIMQQKAKKSHSSVGNKLRRKQ